MLKITRRASGLQRKPNGYPSGTPIKTGLSHSAAVVFGPIPALAGSSRRESYQISQDVALGHSKIVQNETFTSRREVSVVGRRCEEFLN